MMMSILYWGFLASVVVIVVAFSRIRGPVRSLENVRNHLRSLGMTLRRRNANLHSPEGLEDFVLPLASLGPWTAIEHREQIFPWTGRHSILLWVILILAVDMMLIFIVRNLKKLLFSPKQP
jgi:hypothetical protein